jgi:peptidoglycan/xylan/chitin deacetylase (PgdA/CDA1 family)
VILKRHLTGIVKSVFVKRALYSSRLLAAYHRRRNRHRLTVITFHRVLAPTDPRWRAADPEYTLRDDLFAECLEFFKRHYNIVAFEQVVAARNGGPALPRCPLLLTFDDGWADNAEHALGHLRRAGLPAVLFIVADMIDRAQPLFQERLIGAWRRGRLDAGRALQLWREAGGDPRAAPALDRAGRDELEPVREVIARLEQLDPGRRDELLAALAPVLDDGLRHMLTADQARSLLDHRFAIAAHGKTHAPMTRAPDLDAELSGARTLIATRLGIPHPIALSFPHGAHDATIIDEAHRAGYELLFTSVPELASARGHGRGVFGRVGFTSETITDARGRFAPESLALHMFRRPHACT